MINKDYGRAISETLEILSHTKKEDVNKIPIKFLDFLKNNAAENYISMLDFNKSLSEMNLNPRTIGILSIINEKYWCNAEERKQFKEKLKINEIANQQVLNEKYDTNNLFGCKQIKHTENRVASDLTEFQKKKWYQKQIEKILKLLKKR